MASGEDKRFIETSRFPISLINEVSAREKQGGGRPPYWEMVFWWTRKPLAGARAVIAGALLPGDYDKTGFLSELRLIAGKVPHRLNPILPRGVKERFKQAKLLDPFAGFGSIPLEAIRLGVGEVVAVEFLPTAYIFLKAMLEYPKEYSEARVRVLGREIRELELDKAVSGFIREKSIFDGKTYEIPALIYDVARWGRWITKRLGEDPDIKELYDEDAAVYIGTWEVKCPVCGRYTPLVGNWWLAKVKGKRYAYMKPETEGNKIGIKIIEGKTGGSPSPNVAGRPELAECLLCGSRITYIDPRTGRTYRTKNEVANTLIRSRLEFYPKHALKDWNKKLEEYLEGGIALEELRNSLARPRLLVKVKIANKDLKFEPATDRDDEKLWKALEKLRQLWGDPDIPTEPIPSYDNRNLMTYTWGNDKWFKLFNPRQLLTLVKLVKLIRETGKRIEEEKLREGWSREEAHKYAEAITTYLAIAFLRSMTYNSLVTRWKPDSWVLNKVQDSLSTRGIAMTWNWGDTWLAHEDISYNYFDSVETVVDALLYLVSAVSGSSGRVRVLLDDATVLSKLEGERFDVIVTDPPYRDDVPYAELSDFYYVWLKRSLSGDGLALRFHSDALVSNTQWEGFALNEISYNEGRLRYFGVREAEDYYERLMGMAFKRLSELLKDDGLIVTYFAHSSPEAWIELVEAGWRRAGLRVTRAWAFATESPQRVTARGKTALESSIVVVWRKRGKDGGRVGEYVDVYREALENARRARDEAFKSGLTDSDMFLSTMLGALSTFTSYDRVVHFGRGLTSRDVVRESYAIATRVIANATETIRSPEALFYLASKAIFRRYSRPGGQTTLSSAPAEPIVLSSHDVIILSYGFLRSVERPEKEGYKTFVNAGIIKSAEEVKGANVAKQKAFALLEPLDSTIEELKKLLGVRGVNPIKMDAERRSFNSIDALHLLEYYAKQGRSEFKTTYQILYSKYPKQVREAVEVAKVISSYPSDPETNLAKLVRDYIEGV
ncbi:conserved hypothetical protein [Aeropyrum pernix K1]|uniref:DUF1156 domain-containing protein n=1 Tax=Aeropyrum pernix (strain ATCC 700893 / DSM 11879 / JCM 9820 / NBRC 100138 / K1) TaxID=272557 RepID=Q9YF24_AERPE|nr:DUF1156 domain-containing protein [Aeropyrum pernix]BAA79372.2 conserved hypothetical protein [Aeropyrum pernix K1]